MVNIKSVEHGSPAERKGIRAGERLISINGHEINDVLDYRFYSTDKKLSIRLEDRVIKLKKQEYDDLGLEFDTYLMDEKRHCKNKCMFCFIDQMPKGMRDTLYFKDDDARLSFLQGNYITMTNLSEQDVERIIDMRLPMNISVHTTDPDLRVKMTSNPNAGKSLDYLYKMAAAGIELNTQIVLVPGVNDGPQLEKTLTDLCMLYPSVKSVACVPVGLTKYRQGLPEIKPFDKQSAKAAIYIMQQFGDMMYEKYRDRVVYPSDEFFLTAELNMPDYDYYGDFDQFENGVGMCASLQKEFTDALSDCDTEPLPRRMTIATGQLAAPLIRSLIKHLNTRYPQIKVEVAAIRNDFFGENVTVAGLITAGDIIRQLQDKKDALGDRLLITKSMLKADEDIFLDDKTPEDIEEALGIKVVAVENDGYALFDAVTAD